MKCIASIVAASAVLAACAGEGTYAPVATGFQTAHSGSSAAFDPSRVKITSMPLHAPAQVVREGPNGAVYLPGPRGRLRRYFNGTMITTLPATPSPFGTNAPTADAVYVSPRNVVYWIGDVIYNGEGFADTFVDCGGSGGRATVCGPSGARQLTTDASGKLWAIAMDGQPGADTWIVAEHAQMDAGDTQALLKSDQLERPWIFAWTAGKNARFLRLGVLGRTIQTRQQVHLSDSGQGIVDYTFDSKGVLWFLDREKNILGRVDVANGHVRTLSLPGGAVKDISFGEPAMVTACDGGVWFIEPDAHAIARTDDSGDITQFRVGEPRAFLTAITAPPQSQICSKSDLWFVTNKWYHGHDQTNLGHITY